MNTDAIGRWAQWHGTTEGAAWEMRTVVAEVYACGEVTSAVLEIGSHSGASLRVWEEYLRPEVLIGIEHEDSERTRKGSRRQTMEDGLDALAARGAHIIYGSSSSEETWAEVKGVLTGRELDFLYIDGDHRYESVRRDFGLYAPLVRAGGLIVLDDPMTLHQIDTEVYRVVPELQLTHRTKLISSCADPNSPDTGSGSLIVYV